MSLESAPVDGNESSPLAKREVQEKEFFVVQAKVLEILFVKDEIEIKKWLDDPDGVHGALLREKVTEYLELHEYNEGDDLSPIVDRIEEVTMAMKESKKQTLH